MAGAPLKTFLARTQIFSSQLQALPRCATTSSAAHPRRFHGLRDLLLPSHPDRDSGLTPRPTEFAIASVKSTQRGDSAIYNLLASPEWCKFLPRLFIQTGISGRCCHRVTTAISGARPVVTGGAMKVTSACRSGADGCSSRLRRTGSAQLQRGRCSSMNSATRAFSTWRTAWRRWHTHCEKCAKHAW
jgi:hypothetical protein